jgi:predicted phage terminase large subunit-like protein
MAASTTVVTRGTTFDNRANLAPAFFDKVIAKYEGTRLGRQEVYAEILEDNPGALWKRADIDASRVTWLPPLLRVVVAIDPAMTSTEGSDQTGIVVAGLGRDRQFYVLDDVSLNGTPKAWAEAAIAAYAKNKADRIVAEVNNGGEMVEATLRTVNANVPYRAVHASRGKSLRAEPISALYEQHKVHHLGTFAQLEDQMCQWQPGDAWSPDRLDALVWALTELGGADLNSISVQEY